MMDKIKRHAFILGLVAGVVVIGALVIVLVWALVKSPNAAKERTLRSTVSQAQSLAGGAMYTEDLVKQMGEHVGQRKGQYEALVDYIRGLGAAREPAVKDLFPQSTNTGLRHAFKTEYDAALKRFMERLGAALPAAPVEKTGREAKEAAALQKERELVMLENRKAAMFANPKGAFFRPDWVDRQEAPSLDLVRFGQENLWLMEDIVDVLAVMNEEIVTDKAKRTIENVPVKDLIQIMIGSDYATLPGSKMQTLSGRYVPAPAAGTSAAPGATRAPTLTGRYSEPGFFLVLPWRLAVVVEAKYAPELIRRLKGHETFLSVVAWQEKPLGDSLDKGAAGVNAMDREDYGSQGVSRVEIVGESLVWQLSGGRITTLASAVKTTPEPGATETTETTGAAPANP
jgi:hypothetical protein